MSLPLGSRLGPYEIVAPLGAGGMGEVYSARDTRLDRRVAVKVLRSEVMGDEERTRRFEREAKAVAALSHPNILAIHDFGEHGGVVYAVTELLEGETLRARLAAGALPPRKAIDIAAQVAQGLAAAHERGIVHRDLKPENLFVTREGRVKILDFGLARLLPTSASAVANAPTQPQTNPGALLGTVGYMSPEQVRAEVVDGRSDLFALGAVLYEMLAGRRPFQRGSAVETMGAILGEDPAGLDLGERQIPPALDRIVRHCLEKRAEERFQSARDLAFDLESLSTLGTNAATSPLAPPPRHRRLWAGTVAVLASTAALIAGLGLGFAARGWTKPTQSAPASVHARRLVSIRGVLRGARFTRDAQTVVFGANLDGTPRVYTTRRDSPGERPLGIAGSVAAVSESGDLAILRDEADTFDVGLFSGRLARVPLAGGSPRDLLEDVGAADWLPGGQELAVVRMRRGERPELEFPAGHRVLVEDYIGSPRVSPRGDLVAFMEEDVKQENDPTVGQPVVVMDRAGTARTLVKGWMWESLAWSPDGREVVFSGSTEPFREDFSLNAVDLDGHFRTLLPAAGYTLRDVATDGTLLVQRTNVRHGLVALRDGDTGPREIAVADGCYLDEISQDGRFVLCHRKQGWSVFLAGTDGSPAVELGGGLGASFSPDGKWVVTRPQPAFLDSKRTSDAAADKGLQILPVGPGTARRIPVRGADPTWVSFLGDGATLAGTFRKPDGEYFFGVLSRDGGEPVAVTMPDCADVDVVEDGVARGFLYATAAGDVRRVALAGGVPQPVGNVHLAPGETLASESTDGRFLFTLGSLTSSPVTIDRIDLATGARSRWKELPAVQGARVTQVAVGRDGRNIAYSYEQVNADELFLLEGLLPGKSAKERSR